MFLNVLPDPNYKINDAGIEDAAGTAGPGFASLGMATTFKGKTFNTYGGRSIITANTRSHWSMSISYNPLTEAEFSPVYNFVLEKRMGMKAFYVSMPQYRKPKDPTFATFVETATITADEEGRAGAKSLEITEAAWSGDSYGTSGLPKTGDVFNISDSNDSLHQQTYMVSHIDTHTTYETIPTNGNIRIHFFPGLQKKTSVGSEIVFDNPLFRVTQSNNMQDYVLDNEGLYNYTLKLEEALY